MLAFTSSSSSNKDREAMLAMPRLVGSGLDWLLGIDGNNCGG